MKAALWADALDSIVKLMEKIREPLSPNQTIALSGALAVWMEKAAEVPEPSRPTAAPQSRSARSDEQTAVVGTQAEEARRELLDVAVACFRNEGETSDEALLRVRDLVCARLNALHEAAALAAAMAEEGKHG